MDVSVLSKINFLNYIKELNISDETIEHFGTTAIISISKTDIESQKTKPFSFNHKNVLNLAFNDVGEGEEHCFNTYQTKQLLKFLKENKGVSKFLVHCDAGIARSGAIGEFIVNYFNLDYNTFKLNNPKIHPNPYVLQTLNKTLIPENYK